jgi:hypothetical protein
MVAHPPSELPNLRISPALLLSHRRPWYRKFRSALNACQTLDDVDRLLRVKVERWRGRAPRLVDADEDQSEEEKEAVIVEDFGSLFLE